MVSWISINDIFSTDETEMLIVVFQPYGFFGLYNMPADELKARIVDASSIFGHPISSLTDALRSAESYGESISIIEGHFASLFKNSKTSADKLMPVVKTVMQVKGQLTVNELTRLTGQSERRLERVFSQTIGISPAKYLQIVRLHHFLSLIRTAKNRSESLTIAGLESGYYDQPHLIHNFKHITGLTPTQYLSTARALAVNLVIVN